MQIHVVATCGEVRPEDMDGKTAIIIDVLRATSNMVTALAHGCGSIVPVETVEQATRTAKPGDLLGGERGCQKLPGFDLGNSPCEYRRSELQGRRIVVSTTNGTRAVQKARRASVVLACALLNARACAEAAFSVGRDVAIVCSGTEDVFSLEDGLCAGLLAQELMRIAEDSGKNVDINDFGRAMHACYLNAESRLETELLYCANGRKLRRLGFHDDVVYCAQRNIHAIAPALKDGELVPFELAFRL